MSRRPPGPLCPQVLSTSLGLPLGHQAGGSSNANSATFQLWLLVGEGSFARFCLDPHLGLRVKMQSCPQSWETEYKVLGWPKSLFRFFHNIFGKNLKNFMANPILIASVHG